MRKSIIVAASRNGVIGKDGQLPWRLPGDLKRFKELTMGHTLIMGRKTFSSLPPKVCPLPGRRTIVLTRFAATMLAEVDTEHSLGEAITLALMNVNETEVFICGGGEVYKEALPLVDRVYLTVVERDFEGDTRFDFLDSLGYYMPGEKMYSGGRRWLLTSSERGEGDLPHHFEIWDRAR
ncbi:MAG TPA: dihydrofolate reductase [Vicinamibacterales bacterium]|nr:dihydrofolate reductase [Vicinamibacterales bacterium]